MSITELLTKKNPSEETSLILPNKWGYISRIQLIPLSFQYLDDIHEYSTNSQFYRFLEYDVFKTKEETRLHIQKLIDREKFGYFGGIVKYWFIQEKKSKKVIGTVGVCGIDIKRKSGELTGGISPNYATYGYFFEVQFQVIEFCFKTLKLHRLTSLTSIDNQGLINFEKQCGFKQEGLFRDYYLMQDNSRRDAVLTAVLSNEFDYDKCILLAKLSQGK